MTGYLVINQLSLTAMCLKLAWEQGRDKPTLDTQCRFIGIQLGEHLTERAASVIYEFFIVQFDFAVFYVKTKWLILSMRPPRFTGYRRRTGIKGDMNY